MNQPRLNTGGVDHIFCLDRLFADGNRIAVLRFRNSGHFGLEAKLHAVAHSRFRQRQRILPRIDDTGRRCIQRTGHRVGNIGFHRFDFLG